MIIVGVESTKFGVVYFHKKVTTKCFYPSTSKTRSFAYKQTNKQTGARVTQDVDRFAWRDKGASL